MLQKMPLLVPKTEQYSLLNSIVNLISKRLSMPLIKFLVLAVKTIRIAMLTPTMLNPAIQYRLICHWKIFFNHMKWKWLLTKPISEKKLSWHHFIIYSKTYKVSLICHWHPYSRSDRHPYSMILSGEFISSKSIRFRGGKTCAYLRWYLKCTFSNVTSMIYYGVILQTRDFRIVGIIISGNQILLTSQFIV